MSAESIGENPVITLESNSLTVNGNALETDVLNSRANRIKVTSEELGSILVLGRRTILQGTEEFYQKQVDKHPGLTVVRPSIWTAHMGTVKQTDGRNSKVFTELGYKNGGINMSIDEIQPGFHGHWNAVREAGFLPEVQRTSGSRDSGSWLLLRKPSLPQVLHHWFGHSEDKLKRMIEYISTDDKESERRRIHYCRALGERAVDQASDAARSREQIGLILSMAAIKSAIGDKNGYEEEVDDALLYADNDSSIDVSTVRAIENSTFEIG